MNDHELLEQRILAALDNKNAGHEEITSLLAESEQAIATNEETNRSARLTAQDIVACPTPREAADQVKIAEAAELAASRLRKASALLKTKLAEVLQAERVDRYLAGYHKIAAKREELAQKYNASRAAYLAAKSALNEMVDELIDTNIAIDKINGAEESWDRVNGCQRQPYLEQLAVPSFGGSGTAPDWKKANYAAANYAASMVPLTGPPGGGDGSDWWKEIAARNADRRAENAVRIASAAAQAAEREERENSIVRARVKAATANRAG